MYNIISMSNMYDMITVEMWKSMVNMCKLKKVKNSQ